MTAPHAIPPIDRGAGGSDSPTIRELEDEAVSTLRAVATSPRPIRGCGNRVAAAGRLLEHVRWIEQHPREDRGGDVQLIAEILRARGYSVRAPDAEREAVPA